jgi:hypothetical protein
LLRQEQFLLRQEQFLLRQEQFLLRQEQYVYSSITKQLKRSVGAPCNIALLTERKSITFGGL